VQPHSLLRYPSADHFFVNRRNTSWPSKSAAAWRWPMAPSSAVPCALRRPDQARPAGPAVRHRHQQPLFSGGRRWRARSCGWAWISWGGTSCLIH